jgi:hypothetical protein
MSDAKKIVWKKLKVKKNDTKITIRLFPNPKKTKISRKRLNKHEHHRKNYPLVSIQISIADDYLRNLGY